MLGGAPIRNLILLMALAAMHSSVYASRAIQVPLPTRVSLAEHVISGEVHTCKAEWMTLTMGSNQGPVEDRGIYTVCSTKLIERLKGEVPGETVAIFIFGGVVDGIGIAIAGNEISLAPGDEGVFLLYRDEYNGQFWLRSQADFFPEHSESEGPRADDVRSLVHQGQ